MVRRAASSTTEDSLKENSGLPPHTKGKGKETKRERGLSNGKSVARRVQSDDENMQEDNGDQAGEQGEDVDAEEDAEGEEDDEQGAGSPKGRKRARANTNGDARPSGSKVKDEKRAVTLPRDVDGFIPGSIVRVQLKNFVTYDWVEFCPGPYLNMILGPNGTGKSSIACAICLGLNFPSSVLGRASELNAFVKLGTTDGHIEIELKGSKGKPNIIIKRFIAAGTKSSHFSINGQSASGREVNAKMAELNVQVSNLCTFLPQDRVAEFARMTPQQLLKETQRAAGNSNLTNWHETLISTGQELKAIQEALEDDRKQHTNLAERNANLERDVRRFEERKALELEIELLGVIVPYREYHDAKDIYLEAKKRRQVLHDKVKKLMAANAPLDAYKAELAKQCEDLGKQRDAKKASTKLKFNVMNAKWTDNERLEQEADNLKSQLDNLKTREKTRITTIKTHEKQIQKLEEQIANPPKKLSAFRVWDQNGADVVAWLRQNQHRFKMEVMEPPVLSVTISDKRFATSVESCFSNNHLKTFVMQCEEDYKTFNRLVCDTPEALGRTVRVSTWARPKSDIAPPPMSQDTMRGLGFDGYAMDFINYPDGLKMFLQADVQLHRVAIALSAGKVDSNRAMEACSRSGSARFIVGSTMNNVSRSRYGKQLTSNSTYEIRSANRLVTANVDPEVKRRLQADADAAARQLEQVNEQMAQIGEDERALQREQNEFKTKLAKLTQRKEEVSREQTRMQRLRIQLDSNKTALAKLLNAPPIDVDRNNLKRKIIELAKQRVRIVREYQTLIRSAITEQTEATKIILQFLQVSANLAQFQKLSKVRAEKVTEATERFNAVQLEFETSKVRAKDMADIVEQKIKSEVHQETVEKFKAIESSGEALHRTTDQWQDDLAEKKAQLEMAANTNAGVVDQYEQRKKAIERLEEAIAEKEEKVNKKDRAIQIARDKWEPALTKLVDSVADRFAAAFDRIGCAGEIRISQHEDYDKWAIDILVKFRDNEKLQLLTGERQSGGERSLTTIMYLMSLTEEARTPFSLVDEINQGMDARAERAVHNSLVEVTCKADSGQYFLITPKLLPDLNYHERMKVLCVNNGEWLPEDYTRGNMMSMIDAYLRASGRGTSAA
ncbi:hypothetical protein EUX98_g4315 [Antrodiella citrinella]|uniref:Structural maintenance of chromosomes protein 5 n=1 Tax=Antrodiella citrinella TaxID=2447956 RepID=A0A4S4MUA7_9APHY|nr:hypothetical protein EUX98_g4315 [Antrodiella citrinella]